MSYSAFRKLIVVGFISVFLVIIAGSVVRMTGSGMGCPDWPKCFGYYIPPTDVEQIQWQTERSYEKGQIIIYNEALWSAKRDFQSSDNYQSDNWEKYTKHDYAIFNPYHTWTEYINRLFGALSGLICLYILIASFRLKDKKRFVGLSLLIVLGMGFQAWLGATVVYSVLAPVRITLHMLMALLILIFFILLYERIPRENSLKQQYPTQIKIWSYALLLISLIQIVLGTNVRQATDHIIEAGNHPNRADWIGQIQDIFDFHGTFAWLVVISSLGLYFSLKRNNIPSTLVRNVLAVIGFEFLVGLSFKYLDYPAFAQPIHLILASILFCISYLIIYRIHAAKRL